jgi:hypothetical protein
MVLTYLTTDELASRLKYEPRYIRDCLKDSVLIEGTHYIRPFGRRKILYIWERIEADMVQSPQEAAMSAIPLSRGGSLLG